MAIGTAAAIALGLTAAGGAYGAHRQSSAANRAAREQEAARQEALTYERTQQAAAQRRQRQQWDQYQQAYQQWYSRYGDRGIDRYGVPVGVNYRGAAATPAAGGAPGATVPGAARSPVTLAGGRQVDPDEYERYVKAREQRRGQTVGQLAGGLPFGIRT